jgi:hypothetical protein
VTLLTARRSVVAAATGVPPPPFDPINAVNWKHAYWAEDPDWTNPGDGQPVDSWRDAVGNEDAVQATEARQPIYEASAAGMGGRPALRFDSGPEQWLDAAGVEVDQPDTLVAIWRHGRDGTEVVIDGVSVRQGLWSAGVTSHSIFAGSTRSSTFTADARLGPLIQQADFNAGSSFQRVNGQAIQPASPGTNNLRQLRIGNNPSGGNGVNGWAAFIGVRQGTMTTLEREAFTDWALDYYMPVEPTMVTQLGSLTTLSGNDSGMGVDFEVQDDPLTAVGLRVYAAGAHATTLRLWRRSDQVELRAEPVTTVTDEWVEAHFDTPITLEANTRYVVTMDGSSTADRYRQDMNPPVPPTGWLVTPKVRLETGVFGTAGSFPTGTSNHYWGIVDVLFDT